MSVISFFTRSPFLVLSYFLLNLLPAAAQDTQYGSHVAGTPQYVTNPERAVDGNLATAAVLQPATVGLTSYGSSEAVEFPTVISPGTGPSGLFVQVNKLLGSTLGNTLDAAALKKITINAYLNGIPVDSWSMSNLVQANVLQTAQRNTLTVTPTTAFNQLELVLDGALNGYSVNVYEAFAPLQPSPLPVQLVGFRGQATGAGVQLGWTTASKLRSSYFEVERATDDGASRFVALGRVAAAGSSSQARSYQFTDAAPAPLGYYRLRQVDTDGTVAYSPVVVVRAALAATLAAYPSPTTGVLTVASAAGGRLRIFNQQGQLVHQATLAAGAQTLDISALPAGCYWLRDEATGQHLRIAKAE